ncbi:hypothetical protein Glove_199g133 [Diversispora epigaea]|uniref:Uncharacterized protein n=1 Tax=Diversispora epigaea TaxID=1348612 RepID=A0A397IK25_9GLOM|nr:hypothetical protein Glove_199g133 [Diversispora epigaea]
MVDQSAKNLENSTQWKENATYESIIKRSRINPLFHTIRYFNKIDLLKDYCTTFRSVHPCKSTNDLTGGEDRDRRRIAMKLLNKEFQEIIEMEKHCKMLSDHDLKTKILIQKQLKLDWNLAILKSKVKSKESIIEGMINFKNNLLKILEFGLAGMLTLINLRKTNLYETFHNTKYIADNYRFDILKAIKNIKIDNIYSCCITRFFGISKNPSTQNYIIVMASHDDTIHSFLSRNWTGGKNRFDKTNNRNPQQIIGPDLDNNNGDD